MYCSLYHAIWQILSVSKHLRAFGRSIWAHKSLQWPLITFTAFIHLDGTICNKMICYMLHIIVRNQKQTVFFMKITHFGCFCQAFRGPGAHILFRVTQKWFFLFLMFRAEKNRAKSYVTCHAFSQCQRCCRQCRKSTSRVPFWSIFVRRSKIFIPRFINIYISELFTSFWI